MTRAKTFGVGVSVVAVAALVGCTTSVEPTTTTSRALELEAEVAMLQQQLTAIEEEKTDLEGINSQLEEDNDRLRGENETLTGEVERLLDELGQLDSYIGDLESDLALWFARVSELEAILVEYESPAQEPTAQWCAQYQLQLENAGNAHARAQGLSGMNVGMFYEWVSDPLETIGCPVG